MSASEKMKMKSLPFHLLPKDIIVEIPKDIIDDIFSKLPAKSLVRFKCVSKFFCALVTADHGFGVLHRSVSLTLPSRAGILIVIIPRTRDHTRCPPVFYTINNSSEENRRPAGKPPQLQANRVGYLDGEPYGIDHLRSSSDGLVVFLHRNNRRVVVCNVSTGQRISLPRISSPSKITYATLGFDPESKRYKVLVSAPMADRGRPFLGRGRRKKYKHWVLTVGVDKSWRKITNNNNCSHSFHVYIDGYNCPNYSDTSVCIDGVIYSYNCNWLTKVNPVSFGIVAFDVRSESFSVIPFPYEISPFPGEISSCNYSRHAFGLLQVDGGRLAIVCKIMNLSSMVVWTWEKFKKSWEESIISIPLKESSTINQIRFTTNHVGEIVLLSINRKQLSVLIYNLKSKIWRNFDVGGVQEFPIVHSCDVRMYRTMDNVFSLE